MTHLTSPTLTGEIRLDNPIGTSIYPARVEQRNATAASNPSPGLRDAYDVAHEIVVSPRVSGGIIITADRIAVLEEAKRRESARKFPTSASSVLDDMIRELKGTP